MIHTARNLIGITAFTLLAGCAANPYTQYYNQNPGILFNAPQLEHTGAPRIVRIPSFTKDIFDSVSQQGYVQLGMSDFTGTGAVSDSMVRAQAKKIGASLVFVEDHYHHSEQGVQRVATYRPGESVTTTTTGNVSAFGTGGSAFGTYGGTTTSTSSGTVEASYVPATFNHIRHMAFFYARPKS